MWEERAQILSCCKASKAVVRVVRKLVFMKGNKLRGMGRVGDRKHKVGKWRP